MQPAGKAIPSRYAQPRNKVFPNPVRYIYDPSMRNETTIELKATAVKELLRIHKSSSVHWVGNGFPVRSVFNYNEHARELSPFLLLDYAAPYQFPPGNEKRGVGGHPHKG